MAGRFDESMSSSSIDGTFTNQVSVKVSKDELGFCPVPFKSKRGTYHFSTIVSEIDERLKGKGVENGDVITAVNDWQTHGSSFSTVCKKMNDGRSDMVVTFRRRTSRSNVDVTMSAADRRAMNRASTWCSLRARKLSHSFTRCTYLRIKTSLTNQRTRIKNELEHRYDGQQSTEMGSQELTSILRLTSRLTHQYDEKDSEENVYFYVCDPRKDTWSLRQMILSEDGETLI